MTTEFDFTDVETAEAKPINLSLQQRDIMEWVTTGEGNGMIVAVAGAGKTTTLIEAVSLMYGRVAFAAFNKRIADEIKTKIYMRGMSGTVTVNTFHAFGFAAWRRAFRKSELNQNKIREIIKRLTWMEKTVVDGKTMETPSSIPYAYQEFVGKLVSLVRQSAYGIICPLADNDLWNELIAHHALDELLMDDPRGNRADVDEEDLAAKVLMGKRMTYRVLRESIQTAEVEIDFDDMIYMPLLKNVPIDQHDWVLIDEAQDSNPCRRALAKAMLAPGGRLLAVGDPAQAIYGFTGADSSSLDNIVEEFGCTTLDLTVSYRCPRTIVHLAQKWVSHIEAADNAPEGYVGHLDAPELMDRILTMKRNHLELSVVLCRNNQPLVDMAFQLIRNRVPCHVEGRDIGGNIKTLATKWKVKTLDDLNTRLTIWTAREVQKFMARGQEMRADLVTDRSDTLRSLIGGVLAENPQAGMYDLLRLIDTMFADNQKAGLTLSSIHKSKGREWPTVYWLGPNAYQPSRFARQDWQKVQETNLMYVAATRAQERIFQVSVETKKERWEREDREREALTD